MTVLESHKTERVICELVELKPYCVKLTWVGGKVEDVWFDNPDLARAFLKGFLHRRGK